ncbi:MAG: sigma-E processing peptidase SpoIIGA [Clostridia bacterium]|nr:sigma-E processing peptidase SpoIIGA [Clostridia bacterium]
MKPVVYIDVLFFVNFFINFILLCTTSKILKLKTHPLRLSFAAMLGALYAVLIFYPRLGVLYTSAAKILSSLAITATAFNIKGARLYIKALFTLLLVTVIFGGGIFAVMCFTNLGAKSGMFIKNGILYMNLPWQILLISAFILYFIISRIKSAVWGKSACLLDINVSHSGRSAHIKALPDTGNSLCDPLSRAPVIVAEYSALKSILPDELLRIFENGFENNLAEIEKAASDLKCRIRLIPFKSLGCERGMLLGFKPDKTEVILNENTIALGDVIIGLFGGRLSSDNSFSALIHPEIIS